MGNLQLVCTISKESMKLVRAGKAVLSSGGVRLLNGQIVEQYAPTVMKSVLSNSPLSAIRLASSLGNNVQSALIQHHVNVANMKLDTVIHRLDALSLAMDGLQQIQLLSWVNAAFSLANCGISIAGFTMMLNRLESVQGTLAAFQDQYTHHQQNEYERDFQNIYQELKTKLNYLKQRQMEPNRTREQFVNQELIMTGTLNKAEAFIRSVLRAFQGRLLDGQLGCQMIFILTPVYTQLVWTA